MGKKEYDLMIFPEGEIEPYYFQKGWKSGKERIGGLLICKGENKFGGVITREDCLKLKILIEELLVKET